MKIVDGLLQKVLEIGSKKEICVNFISRSQDGEYINGIVKAIDPNMKWILIEQEGIENESICFLINFKDVSCISYFKCNGVDNHGSGKKQK